MWEAIRNLSLVSICILYWSGLRELMITSQATYRAPQVTRKGGWFKSFVFFCFEYLLVSISIRVRWAQAVKYWAANWLLLLSRRQSSQSARTQTHKQTNIKYTKQQHQCISVPILNLSDMTGETVHVDYIHVHHVFVHIGGTWETGMGDMESVGEAVWFLLLLLNLFLLP